MTDKKGQKRTDKKPGSPPKGHVAPTIRKHMKNLEPYFPVGLLKKPFRNLIMRKNKERLCVVTMEMNSGDQWTKYVVERDGGFLYNDGFYILDNSAKVYNQAYGCYHWFFHESCALPVKVDIDVNSLHQAIDQGTSSDIALAVHPTVLRKALLSDIAKKIVAGQQLDDMLKTVTRIVIINLIVTAIIALVVLNMSGVLKNILPS